jgi:phosphatidylinositol kinase/protein kinase (PI-3  family)
MLCKNGRLFHIDFGRFLGNIQMWKNFKRERAPFVLSPEYAFVMGGRESETFSQVFVSLCTNGYNILREHTYELTTLFVLMLHSGITEIRSADDIQYLRLALSVDYTTEEATALFTKLIFASLKTKATRFNNAVHIFAHRKLDYVLDEEGKRLSKKPSSKLTPQ